jgi:hypothetical protein
MSTDTPTTVEMSTIATLEGIAFYIKGISMHTTFLYPQLQKNLKMPKE